MFVYVWRTYYPRYHQLLCEYMNIPQFRSLKHVIVFQQNADFTNLKHSVDIVHVCRRNDPHHQQTISRVLQWYVYQFKRLTQILIADITETKKKRFKMQHAGSKHACILTIIFPCNWTANAITFLYWLWPDAVRFLHWWSDTFISRRWVTEVVLVDDGFMTAG